VELWNSVEQCGGTVQQSGKVWSNSVEQNSVEQCGGALEQCGTLWNSIVEQYGWNSLEQYSRRVEVWSREQWNSTVELWNSKVEQCGTVWNSGTVWQSVVEPGRIKVGR